ncbi:motility protein A [Methylococcus sp. EFPC2]|uniref:motility protein A n=1 Tax=Methylococcus sp. EFPC2 TaxID=2812648 RepID=UPI0019673244|nr:MotA/TolQ/ExbB proton channel family protein [Methylococcus sp. EFPC2]QSA96191.1 MotA/TolQ/ExbB proton channel family protein [Methylococcus sp. EFPC2]
MKRHTRLAVTVLALAAFFTLVWRFDPSGHVFNLPGLLVVLVGVYLATALGQSFGSVWTLVCKLPEKLAPGRVDADDEVDIELFLKACEFHRQSNVKYAELALRRIGNPFLKSGAQLVLDRTPIADIQRVMDWSIGAQRERDHTEIQVFQTMMGYAPAFGMVGTLFGLIAMLYGLEMNNLRRLGADMGFAMLTTVYGLLLANLILKPVVTRLELRSRERLAWLHAQQEMVMMMHEQCHPKLIREHLAAFRNQADAPEREPEPRLLEAGSHS